MTIEIFTDSSSKFPEYGFVGGVPSLPPGMALPKCLFCGRLQTFFFQIEFPDWHYWSGKALALFVCVECYQDDYTIPEMLDEPLKGAKIPDGFLREYQNNFRVFVFDKDSSVKVDSYTERVVYKPLVARKGKRSERFGKFSIVPDWVLEDEFPGSYHGNDLVFLFQMHFDVEFSKYDSAPSQARMPEFRVKIDRPYYFLFNYNAVYFFGLRNPSDEVYILTQN